MFFIALQFDDNITRLSSSVKQISPLTVLVMIAQSCLDLFSQREACRRLLCAALTQAH